MVLIIRIGPSINKSIRLLTTDRMVVIQKETKKTAQRKAAADIVSPVGQKSDSPSRYIYHTFSVLVPVTPLHNYHTISGEPDGNWTSTGNKKRKNSFYTALPVRKGNRFVFLDLQS